MYPYRVAYLESRISGKSQSWNLKGHVDGYETSKQLEALILEKSTDGYELFSITPLTGMAVKSPYSVTTTIGLLALFRSGPLNKRLITPNQ